MSLADAPMILLGFTGAACFIAGVIQRNAPLGWQDFDGFHLGEQISEINNPSQLAHSQPGSISERAGKGDGFDHEKGNDQ